MKNKIKQKLYWFDHFIWLLGWMYKFFIVLDISSGIDTWNQLQIHCNYSRECIGYKKISLKQKINNILHQILGVVITGFIIYVLHLLLTYIIQWINR